MLLRNDKPEISQMTKKLILASASPRRLELLKQIGIVPDAVIPADIDETPKAKELPATYAERIAAEKAKIVFLKNPDAIILSADTVVALGRRILPKAETEEEARQCLSLLSGRRHRVLTAVSICASGKKQKTITVSSVVKFKRLSDLETAHYLQSLEWKGKAGGYAIQGLAATLISSISGSYSGIVGLPLYETARLLEAYGDQRSRTSGG